MCKFFACVLNLLNNNIRHIRARIYINRCNCLIVGLAPSIIPDIFYGFFTIINGFSGSLKIKYVSGNNYITRIFLKAGFHNHPLSISKDYVYIKRDLDMSRKPFLYYESRARQDLQNPIF